jgi:hypothetical protein
MKSKEKPGQGGNAAGEFKAAGLQEARPWSTPHLSQSQFPHWWKDRVFRQRFFANEIPIEEQKAAVWYEAARRRPEVKQAWLEGKCLLGDIHCSSPRTSLLLPPLMPSTRCRTLFSRNPSTTHDTARNPNHFAQGI